MDFGNLFCSPDQFKIPKYQKNLKMIKKISLFNADFLITALLFRASQVTSTCNL